MRLRATHSSKILTGTMFKRAAQIFQHLAIRLPNTRSNMSLSTALRSRRSKFSRTFSNRTIRRPSVSKAGPSSTATTLFKQNYRTRSCSNSKYLNYKGTGGLTLTMSDGKLQPKAHNSPRTRNSSSLEVTTTNISEERRNERLRKAIEQDKTCEHMSLTEIIELVGWCMQPPTNYYMTD